MGQKTQGTITTNTHITDINTEEVAAGPQGRCAVIDKNLRKVTQTARRNVVSEHRPYISTGRSTSSTTRTKDPGGLSHAFTNDRTRTTKEDFMLYVSNGCIFSLLHVRTWMVRRTKSRRREWMFKSYNITVQSLADFTLSG